MCDNNNYYDESDDELTADKVDEAEDELMAELGRIEDSNDD